MMYSDSDVLLVFITGVVIGVSICVLVWACYELIQGRTMPDNEVSDDSAQEARSDADARRKRASMADMKINIGDVITSTRFGVQYVGRVTEIEIIDGKSVYHFVSSEGWDYSTPEHLITGVLPADDASAGCARTRGRGETS